MSNRRRPRRRPCRSSGGIVPQTRDSEGHNTVILEHPVNGPAVMRVCELVMLSFEGPCPPGHVIEHINGDLGDDNRQNLRYIPVG